MSKKSEKIKETFERTYMKLHSIVHPIEKKIVFSSFAGKQYSDSPRAISEKMHELYPDYEIVWLYDRDNDIYNIVPSYIRCVPFNKRRTTRFDEISTAFAYVTNEDIDAGLTKRKGQFFIQTWHGDRPLKKVLYDANTGKKIMDQYYTDLCVAASDIGEKVYRSAFRYSGDILKVGMPRNDKLVCHNNTEKEIIRQRIGLKPEMKVLLYAPTFRDNINCMQTVNLDIKSTIDALEENGEKWICLIRSHSASKGLDIKCDGETIIDVSSYPDMADLLLLSDMLITDYSSSAGDFVLTHRPVILNLFDEQEYKNNCRAFYFSCDDAGFVVARNQKELETIIKTYTLEDYRHSCDQIIKYFNIVETGHSAEEVCNLIDKNYKNNFNKK